MTTSTRSRLTAGLAAIALFAASIFAMTDAFSCTLHGPGPRTGSGGSWTRLELTLGVRSSILGRAEGAVGLLLPGIAVLLSLAAFGVELEPVEKSPIIEDLRSRRRADG